jgi:hypothetical protein
MPGRGERPAIEMRRVNLRPLFVIVVLCTASVVAACTTTTYGSPGPLPTTAPRCIAPGCVKLGSGLHNVSLPKAGGVAVTAKVAGRGFISLRVSDKQFSAPGLFAILMRRPDLSGAVLYVEITAIKGPATLPDIPGLRLVFPGKVPSGTLRLAALEAGVWTTVGKPASVHGKTVTFSPEPVTPAIHLDSGKSYELSVYSGGVVPPTPTPSPSPTQSPTPSPSPTHSPTPSPSPTHSPTPSPSPTHSPTPAPGALTVAAMCTSSADSCSNGSMSNAGSVQFTAVNDTATLTPSETPSSTYTLKSDTCNPTDDPSAGGNWATFSPAAGQSGTSFTVTARNGGASGNPANCQAVFSDSSGQTVTIDIGVTVSNVGIH